ncbi:MAG: glycosyl hydrolase family 2, partial [Muribaculaceae bacterium]|nr:glycosyl hydrolase family 2 [Muribaculaceae bacterium]
MSDGLWESFLNPSPEARTKVWWFHGETETTKDGIDSDLQAFKDAGIGGVVFYDQTHGAQEGACASLSPEWWKMLKHAALKARELGLSFDMAATNGYVAGGPWIKPENGMKKIVTLRPGEPEPQGFMPLLTISTPPPDTRDFIDTLILKERVSLTDNQPIMIPIDFNEPKEIRTISYTVRPRGKGAYGSMNIPGKPQKDYFGAMYILFPPIGQLESSDDGVNWTPVTSLRGIEDVIGHKSKQRTINFPPVKARHFRLNIHDWQGDSEKHNNLYIENVKLMSYDMTDNWETKSGLRSELPSECDVATTDGFRPFAGKATIGYA